MKTITENSYYIVSGGKKKNQHEVVTLHKLSLV